MIANSANNDLDMRNWIVSASSCFKFQLQTNSTTFFGSVEQYKVSIGNAQGQRRQAVACSLLESILSFNNFKF